jgi:galactokinase
MDQFAVTFGKTGNALLLDCRSLEHDAVALPADVEMLVCDSGVERRLASSGYARRREECRRAVEQISSQGVSVASLRDVDARGLEAARPGMDDVAFRRARHVVTENRRVLDAVEALRRNDLDRLGATFAASHESLRDDYEVSTPELDELVHVATSAPGVIGARLTGAGFGGAIVVLVHGGTGDAAASAIATGYRAPDGSAPPVLRVRAADGAGRVWPSP